MTYNKTIQIDSLLPETAEKKALAAQQIVSTLDQDTLEFVATLCRDKGAAINTSLRNNAELIRTNL
ncbi:MAG: hypothetical protein K9H61_02285 [Bacteroidia bacterium]|nr:hypothetical protein [Bacteroidia bacterium]MCF8427154.1 hypothetical protein [Bacteroidia bacterium]MCF8445799.1 hypothetical protein [Bacteroidia bacterium]